VVGLSQDGLRGNPGRDFVRAEPCIAPAGSSRTATSRLSAGHPALVVLGGGAWALGPGIRAATGTGGEFRPGITRREMQICFDTSLQPQPELAGFGSSPLPSGIAALVMGRRALLRRSSSGAPRALEAPRGGRWRDRRWGSAAEHRGAEHDLLRYSDRGLNQTCMIRSFLSEPRLMARRCHRPSRARSCSCALPRLGARARRPGRVQWG